MMHLMMPVSSTGFHLAGWRHPDAWDDTVFNLDQAIEIAKTSERARFDLLFLADIAAVSHMDTPELFAFHAPTSRSGGYEPMTLFANLAAHTDRIGLVATGSTTYDEPYSLARRVLSLDGLSGGRAGWNVVTGAFPEEAMNFNRDEQLPKSVRYERAREFAEVTLGLWDSWAADAFPEDKTTGRYLDPERVHVLDHKGEYFQVRGPLNVSRSPQGRPLVFHAGQSEAGLELASSMADCVFAAAPTKERGIELRKQLRERVAAKQRDPDDIRVLPGVTPYIGRTKAEAEQLMADLDALVTPEVAVEHLSRTLGFDLSGYPIDGPMPEITGSFEGIEGKRQLVNEWVAKEALTVRQAFERFIPGIGNAHMVGTPAEVADEIEDWWRSGACDGFLVSPPVMPKGLNDFADLVVPLLQERGTFRREYAGSNLRELMGLPIPPNRFFES